jgi:DNA segregation ATPase FtsK/SpoIIIE, S-DNA-T family
LSPLRLVAHRYACTARPEKIAELLPIFVELQEELFRRAEVIEGLSYEECPENKVTPELASRRDLRLEPIMVGVDECHELFEHEETAVREAFIKIFTDLVKRGPALGIMVYLATQKPSAKSIPTAIAHNAIIRICLKVLGWQANDQVLGDGMSKAGLKAQMFAWADKGICYLRGEGADAQVVRSVHGLDQPTADVVARRARVIREAAGRLTGDAAGEQMVVEAEEVALVDCIGQVMGTTQKMHLSDIAKGMAQRWPTKFPKLTAAGLGKLLRGLTPPIEPGTVWVSGKGDGKGVTREQLNISTTSQVAGEDPEDGKS